MKKIKLKNIIVCDLTDNPDLITHSGTFHADEVFATIVLQQILDKDIIKMSRVNSILKNEYALIYDIGGGKYDHHQIGGNGERENGIKYAAFGLVWKEFGIKFLKTLDVSNEKELWNMVDEKLVQVIDATDNGQLKNTNQFNIETLSLSKLISLYNSNWNEEQNQDSKFLEAIEFATNIFNKLLETFESKIKAKEIIKEKIKKTRNNILILEKFVPWKETILENESQEAKNILYVITPSNREGYTIMAVPKEVGTFEVRKPFPKSWAGLRDEELVKETGVETATFCHNNKFLCVTKTKEDAIALAKLAIKK